MKAGEIPGLIVGVVTQITATGYRNDVYPKTFGKTREESLYIQRLIRFNRAYLKQHDNQQKAITMALQENYPQSQPQESRAW